MASRFTLLRRWLLADVFLILTLGVLLVVLGLSPSQWSNDPIRKTFWGSEPLSIESFNFYRWAFGVWGATMAGWAIMLFFIVQHPFKRAEKWSWQAVALGLFVWFPLDTYFSYRFGFTLNVLLNVSIFILVMLPLTLSRKHFAQTDPPI